MIEPRADHVEVVMVANPLNSTIAESVALLRGQCHNGHHGIGDRLWFAARANAVTASLKHRVVRGRHFGSDGPANG